MQRDQLVCGLLIKNLTENGARKATFYFSPKLVAKATRQRRPDRRTNQETFVVTLGRPNYAERKFIKTLKAAGEPFPVKKIQYKFYPKKKAA